jgi:hypothetical protein
MATKLKLAPMSLDELRALIRTTQAELTGLESAPVPVEEAEAQLAAALAHLASLFIPDAVLQQFTRTPAPGVPTLELLLGDPEHDVMQCHAALAFAFGDLLLAAWRPRLQALYADPALRAAAVPTAERPARREALRQTLDELELAEERAICEAEARGQQIDRRPDARPEVIFDPLVLSVPEAPAPPAT